MKSEFKNLRHLSALRPHLAWIIGLCFLAVLPFASVAFSSGRVLSDSQTDVVQHFLYSRAFGFGEMAAGNLPLWNPYLYGGIPYLGEFQSALLYPLNALFLILPIGAAINWSFLLHVAVLGIGTYTWAGGRGLSRPASFVSGVVAMFSGTFILHIYAGHLSNVCSMAWAPWIFWGIDGWLARRHGGWIVLASGAVALQIYAGHPQYVYFNALIAGLYSLLHLVGTFRLRSAAIGLLAIYPGGILLAAAQLFPGIAAASEAVRSGGANYEFAAMFSFPPENLLTVCAPWLFGDMQRIPYWGRCYLWEMCAFSGVAALSLAVFGSTSSDSKFGARRLLVVLGIAILLALGAHTPFHQFLYSFLPGFSSFRGSSKFIFFAGLIFALLAGKGFQRLLAREEASRVLIGALFVLGVILCALPSTISTDALTSVARQISATRESYFPLASFNEARFQEAACKMAGASLRLSGGVLFIAALLFALNKKWRSAPWAMGALVVVELVLFARTTVTFFPLETYRYRPLADFFKQNPGDYRVLNLINPDSAMLLRMPNIWGYDPGVLKRYAQLLFVSQGLDPATATQNLPFRTNHPILGMLRGRFAFTPKPDGQVEVAPFNDPFQQFALYSQYRVIPNPNALLAELKSPTFDLRKEVLLDSEPVPVPESGEAAAKLHVRDRSTDHWTLEVETDRAVILVMTDSYSKDWRVESLEGSVQINYNILPANHALRAIPLAAGKHRIRIAYCPQGLEAGFLTTTLTLVALGIVASKPAWRKKLDFA